VPARAPKPFTPAQERVGRVAVRLMTLANNWVYRASGGRLGARFRGAPVLLLTTVGRRSGQPRTVPLLYLEDGNGYVVVASVGGMSRNPAWFRNLEANPEVEVQVGPVRRRMLARRAGEGEKAAFWPKLVALYADYDVYQRRTERNIPVVVLSPH